MSLPRLAACVLALGPLARAQDPAPPPRVALVLSSGGPRGLAHVGVLQALAEQRIAIDIIVGSEWGALVGGLYAAGLSPEEIQQALLAPDWIAALRDRGRRETLSFRAKQEDREFLIDLPLGLGSSGLILPPGLYGGGRLRLELARMTLRTSGTSRFDDLPCAFRAVATDFEDGNAVTLDNGSLAQAIEASMSTPVLWPPVRWNGRTLVSGALSAALPVDVALASEPGTLIVVDLGGLQHEDGQKTFVDVGARVLDIAAARRAAEGRAKMRAQDILCTPDVQRVDLADFANAAKLIERGHAAGMALHEQLAPLAIGPEVYAEHLQRRRARHALAPRIEHVKVAPGCSLSEESVRAYMDQEAGETLDPVVAGDDLARLYGLRIFQRVDLEVQTTEPGHADLVVYTEDLPTAPLHWRTGLTGEVSAGTDVVFVIGAGVRCAPTDGWGSEARFLAEVGNRYRFQLEYRQALQPGGNWFLVPSATWERRPLQVDVETGVVTQFNVQELDLGIDVVREIGNDWEARAGYVFRKGRSSIDLGDTEQAGAEDFDESGVRLGLTCDSLDDIAFPSSGTGMNAQWFKPVGSSTEENDETASLQVDRALLLGDQSLVLGAEIDTVVGDTQNVQSFSSLGGFLRLSGLPTEAISGPTTVLARAVFLHPLQPRSLEGRVFTWYAGASLEFGNVFSKWSDVELASLRPAGSMFLGIDTFLGPAYVGYGASEGGDYSVFLVLGSVF